MFVPREHSWIFEPRLSTRRDRGSPNMKMKTYHSSILNLNISMTPIVLGRWNVVIIKNAGSL